MALASLTIDLIANLSRFEGDMGRAAQIATRDGERMTKAAQAVERALQKQADQVGRTQAEYLALKAAEAGLGEGIQRYIDIVARSGTVTSTANANSAASFGAIGAAAESSADRQKRANVELVTSIRQVNEAYAEQRRALVAQESSGAITTDKFKVDLTGLTARRNAAVEQLKLTSAQQIADAELAASATAAAESRRAAALKIVDAQNGITASYRQQLQALRELRDAGALTPAQFKQAGTDLVSKQPVVQQRATTAAADAQADQAAANAQAKRITQFEALRQSVAQKNYAAAQSAADAERSLAEKTAASEAETLAKRAIGTQRLYDTVARLAYESSQKQIAAAESAAAAEAAIQAKRNEAFAQLRSNVSKQNYDEGVAAKRAAAKEIEDAAKRVANATEQQAAAQARAAASFKASIETEAATIGKSRAEILAYKAAQHGLTEELGASIAKIALADANLVKYGHHAGLAAGQVGLNVNQLLTLKYTISDIVASLGSGISPFTILTQQGGQLAQIEGGIGGIFRGLISYINPATAAVGLFAVGVSALAYAWYEGAEQGKRFADAVVLSGNFAGQTAGKFTEATREIAANGQVSVSAARDFGQALLATGQIGPTVFKAATEAAARYGAATGKNAKEIAADFASMGEDVFKWATEHNKQLNFASQAELEHIRVLQETGRSVEAQAEVYAKLNERFRGLEPNLGTLDRILRGVTSTWHEFWDAAFDVGRPETIEQKIEKARRAAAAARDFAERESKGQVDNNERVTVGGGTNPAGTVTRRPGTDRNGVDNADEYLRILNRSKATQESNVAYEAETKALNKSAAAADEYVRSRLKMAKASSGLVEAQRKEEAEFKKQDALAERDPAYAEQTANIRSKATRDALRKKTLEEYTDKPAASDANQQRKAQLEQDLKFFRDNFAREKQTLQFGQQELQALYNAGAVSLVEYYDRKRANIADGVQAELDELVNEQARLEIELERGGFKNQAEKTGVQTKLNDVVEQTGKVARQAAQDVKIANIEEGESFRQLGLRIQDFRAQLAQLGGDEGQAARLRAASAIDAVQRQQNVSAGRPDAITDEEVQAFKRRTEAALEFAEIQRKLGEAGARAATQEDTYVQSATRGGATLQEIENGVYLIRSAQLSQLGELRDRVQALADASTDPKLQQFARDLGLAYAKAADAVDPFFNRLREGSRELSQDIASTIGNTIASFGSIYRAEAANAAKDAQNQRASIDSQIDRVKKALAATNDAKQAARLQDQLRELEAQRKAAGNTGNLFLTTIRKNLIEPIGREILATMTKVAITQPIQKATEGQINKFLGKTSVGDASAAAEKAAAAQREENSRALAGGTTAIDRLTKASEAAATVLERIGGKGDEPSGKDFPDDYGAANEAREFAERESGASKKLTTEEQAKSDAITTSTRAQVTNTDAVLRGASQISRLAGSSGEAAIALLRVVASVGGSVGSGIAKLFSGSGSGSNVNTSYGYENGADIGFKLAEGTNYVPYDGMKAILHKGESVTPAKYNPAAGGVGSGRGNTVVNVHPGSDTHERTETNEDGSVDIFMKASEERLASNYARGRSPLNAAMKTRGISQSRGLPKRG